MKAKRVRIMLVDDHEMVRRGLRTVLEGRNGYEICGEAGNGREAVKMAAKLRPDVVVMDLTMPELGGLEATRRILKEVPDCSVLVLSMHESEQLIHEVLHAGARGYVLKSDAGTQMVEAVRAVAEGATYFTSKVSDLMLNAYVSPRDAEATMNAGVPLTSREREIAQLIGEGKSTKEIASSLGISVKTAETHRTNLMRKLGVHSVSEVVKYAIRNNLVAP
jgi:DNA-binding NarL/FixJ family response regulator